MNANKIIVIINILVTIGFLIWLAFEPSWEPFVGALASIATLIGVVYNNNDSSKPKIMKQKGGKNSTNYQSGGDITINQHDKR